MKSKEISLFITDKKYRKKVLQKIKRNSHFMNQIFSKVVSILVSKHVKNKKLQLLLKLKNPQNNKLLTTKEAKHILRLENSIQTWYSKIYNLKKQHFKNIQSGKGLLFNSYIQKGGNDMTTQKPKITLFDWIFFPLWSIEQTPYGGLLEVSLDITELILENLDPIIGAVAPFVPDLLSIAVDAGQAIPGVGTTLAPLGIGLNLLDEPLEYFIANSTDIIGLLINISRKNWTLALISLLEVIPNFDSFMDTVTTNIYYTNKYLTSFNENIHKILPVLDKWTPLATTVLSADPNKIQESILQNVDNQTVQLLENADSKAVKLLQNSDKNTSLLHKIPASPLIKSQTAGM